MHFILIILSLLPDLFSVFTMYHFHKSIPLILAEFIPGIEYGNTSPSSTRSKQSGRALPSEGRRRSDSQWIAGITQKAQCLKAGISSHAMEI